MPMPCSNTAAESKYSSRCDVDQHPNWEYALDKARDEVWCLVESGDLDEEVYESVDTHDVLQAALSAAEESYTAHESIRDFRKHIECFVETEAANRAPDYLEDFWE